MSFCIATDSCSNLPIHLIDKYDIVMMPMIYIIDGEEKLSYSKDTPETVKSYYDMVRSKKPVSTSCAPHEVCVDSFEPVLKAGNDLYYIGFSSALSATYQNAANALEELKLKYPERKIYYTDSLCASMGQGRLVASAAEKREEGLSISEVYDWVEDNKRKLCHLFTVESLAYLHRGGRVKKGAAILADTLNIKPVLHVDNSGALIPVGKVFGRKASLVNIAKRIADTIVNPEQQTIFVGHGDSLADAEFLIKKLSELVKFKAVEINFIDLVIGVHSGPGTIAIFYYGNSRY